jgi:hypothetical protein
MRAVACMVNPSSIKISAITRAWSTGSSNMGVCSIAVLAKSVCCRWTGRGLPCKTSLKV